MNIQHYTLKTATILLLGTLLACEGKRTVEEETTTTTTTTTTTEREEDTALVARTGETTEEKLERLRGWMNEKKDRTDTAIRSNWPQTREELRRINKDIESNFDSLSAESKEEYRQLKSRYESWEAQQERRQQRPLNAAKITTWKDQLLREYKDINQIKPANIREAYLTFMGTVRIKKNNWTQDDWDYVDHVYRALNDRREQIESQIATGDRLKIRALQAEYLALEGAADTESMVRGVDEK
ncbi:hypothetical protein WG947_08695 [Pontibacter sp. H259]|uniref:hypothetical protein n=1 Tax=Pontibacter sp. H259 TaxID=3133421 RepID=UPI0030C2C178